MRFLCPCCGYPGLQGPAFANLRDATLIRGLQPPYRMHFGIPSYEVCGCCGFEFGNDDEPGTAQPTSFEEHLTDWIAGGCVWFDAALRPNDWSLAAQLDGIGEAQ